MYIVSNVCVVILIPLVKLVLDGYNMSSWPWPKILLWYRYTYYCSALIYFNNASNNKNYDFSFKLLYQWCCLLFTSILSEFVKKWPNLITVNVWHIGFNFLTLSYHLRLEIIEHYKYNVAFMPCSYLTLSLSYRFCLSCIRYIWSLM